MDNEITIKDSVSAETIEKVIVEGDLSRLTSQERVSYYNKICSDLGLNPLTKPFEYIKLNGKLTLYALRACTEQLRSTRGVSITILSRETVNDCYVVTAQASLPNGRKDESIGAVSIKGLSGDALCNAIMKSETKAKRRATLSLCALGFLDETEIETIPKSSIQIVANPTNEETVKNIMNTEFPKLSASAEKAYLAIENAQALEDCDIIDRKLHMTKLEESEMVYLTEMLEAKRDFLNNNI